MGITRVKHGQLPPTQAISAFIRERVAKGAQRSALAQRIAIAALGREYSLTARQATQMFHNATRAVVVGVCMTLGMSASAQDIVRDSAGNYHERDAVRATVVDSATTFTYTYDHGSQTYTLPVWRGPKGGLYVWKLDGKLGVQRKVYLPKQ